MKNAILVSLLALAFFAGCVAVGTDFDYSDAKRIRPGMTTDQVIAVMKSKPYVTEVHGLETHFVWVYAEMGGRTKQMRVRFDQDGRVIAVPVIP